MTRLEILNAIKRRLNKSTSSTDPDTRLLGFMDETHRWVLSQPGMELLRRQTVSMATSDDTAEYALPDVQKVNRMWETTNDRVLYEMSLDQYRRYDPDPLSNEGTPEAFVWMGYSTIRRQPTTAQQLIAVSTSASDTQVAYVEGEAEGGYPRTAQVTLTGTVDANPAGSDWVHVSKFYLASVAVGTVTLRVATPGVLVTISPGLTMQRYCRIALWPSPAEQITYAADVVLDIPDLAQSTTEPMLPREFHDLLIYGAMVREYEHMDDTRLAVAEIRFDERMKTLNYWLAETAMGTMRAMPDRSRFTGGYYPSGPF